MTKYSSPSWLSRNRKKAIFFLFLAFLIGAAAYGQHRSIPDTDVSRPYDPKKLRTQDQTYLTFPEWFIVYSSDEYAQFIKDKAPSAFPYLESSWQYWQAYHQLYEATKDKYPFNAQYHVMLGVIGASMSVEYAIKFAWEETIGHLSEMTRKHGPTDEEKFAYATAEDYVTFIRIYPWYEYPFGLRLKQLWQETSPSGDDMFRKWERKTFLSFEYGGKAFYGWLLGGLTRIGYEEEPLITFAEVAGPEIQDGNIKYLASDNGRSIVSLPRYDAFLKQASVLAESGVQFVTVEGNNVILITVIAPEDWHMTEGQGHEIFSYPILTHPAFKRIGVELPVPELQNVLVGLKNSPAKVEHIYDY